MRSGRKDRAEKGDVGADGGGALEFFRRVARGRQEAEAPRGAGAQLIRAQMKPVGPDFAREPLVAAEEKKNAAFAANLLQHAGARGALRVVIVAEDQGGAGGESARDEARLDPARAIGRKGKLKRRRDARRRVERARGSC